MSSGINQSAGSLYLNKTTLQEQFNPSSSPSKDVQIHNSDVTVSLKGETYVDLTRLGKLVVNGESVYENPQYQSLEGEEGSTEFQATKTNFVFNRLEEKLSSTKLAMQAANLMQQGLANEVIIKMLQHKKLNDEETATITHDLKVKNKVNVMTTDTKKFTFIHEDLVEKADTSDPENESKKAYFKIKTIVRGSLADLEAGKAEKMSLETAYTKEQPKMAQALRSDYTGTAVGGLRFRDSYIKA
jgi:hypothetical protein